MLIVLYIIFIMYDILCTHACAGFLQYLLSLHLSFCHFFNREILCNITILYLPLLGVLKYDATYLY